jgi:hypothetical protein
MHEIDCVLLQDFVPWSSLQCVASVTIYSKLVAMVLLPPVLLLLLSAFFLVALAVIDRRDMSADYSQRHARRQRWKYRFYKLTLFTLFLM